MVEGLRAGVFSDFPHFRSHVGPQLSAGQHQLAGNIGISVCPLLS
jgi:hypothetical protein